MILECTFLALWLSIATIFVQIFVGVLIFLLNESIAKRLATCIGNFSVKYHNFTFKSAVFLFVPSGLCSLAPAVYLDATQFPVKLAGGYPS